MPPKDFWLELLLHMPTWFFPIAALMLLAGMAVSVGWLIVGAKRVAQAMGREDRFIQLQADLVKERDSSRLHAAVASQVTTALANVRLHLETLNALRQGTKDPDLITAQALSLAQQVVEALASDVKHLSGERHRCGLWAEDGNYLVLIAASSGFPPKYVNRRRLGVNTSTAGRCFRRGQTIRLSDVRQDQDWEPNPESSSPYQALICIPITDGTRRLGVLTLDARWPMTDEDVLIGELYATLIEGAMYEGLMAAAKAAAATNEVHERT